MIRLRWRFAPLFAALALAGCVDSAEPLIGDAQPLFGPDVHIHLYVLGEDQASGPDVSAFHWDGHEYRLVGRPGFEIASFSATALAGNDLLVQSRSTRPQIKGLEYGIARKLAPGVYMVRAIDEDDAEAATRAKFCATGGSDSCRVTSREALLALAGATAAKPELKGSLAIVVGPPKR